MPKKKASEVPVVEDDVVSRLSKSHAVRSLVSEQRVQQVLEKLRWDTQQSHFYPDPITGKLRELDVFATQLWRRPLKSDHLARLHLLVEVKSAAGYHIVFSDAAKPARRVRPVVQWIGYEDRGTRARIARSLEVGGLGSDEIREVIAKLPAMAFPRHNILVSPLIVDAPAAPLESTSFRETNIGTDKDLDNSVLWRSVQSLVSCVEALKERRMEVVTENLSDHIEIAKHLERKPIEMAFEQLREDLRMVDLFHAVIVIDAALWSASGDTVSPLEWCRLEQSGIAYERQTWVDVVQSKSFTKFARQVTDGYRNQYRKVARRY